MRTELDPNRDISLSLQQTARASQQLMARSSSEIQSILLAIADQTEENIDFILRENKKDLERMDPENPKYDRLLLNNNRLASIIADIRKVASLQDPLHLILEEKKLTNGLHLTKVSVPIGVVGIIFESRPNVTFDVVSLCLKSGNAVVLKGSRDAHFSNLAIVQIIENVLTSFGLKEAIFLAPSPRESLPVILNAVGLIDIIIPRGSQGLIDFVRENAKVPVIETGAGIVHTYFDKSGDLTKGKAIIENAKTRRVSVCNALDTLIIHADRIYDLPNLVQGMDAKHGVQIFADPKSYVALKSNYDPNLLDRAEDEHFGTEFLSLKMSIRTVSNLDEAIQHISKYSSKHSEAIIAEDKMIVEKFCRQIDAAAVYANTSTAFTDGGEFGLGAEIGISTQKLHARGPMGLRELTSYKWIIKGNGQIRSKS